MISIAAWIPAWPVWMVRASAKAVYRKTHGPRRRFARPAVLAVLLVALLPSCKNFNLFSLEQDMALGDQTYDSVLADENAKPVTSGPDAEMVQRVTARLVEAAVERHPEYEVFEWETTLLDDPTVNAFCLPGGKMVVFSGILPYARNEATGDVETGLAVVMGHEIAHATQRHGTEKMTRALGLEWVATLGSTHGGEYVDEQLVDTGLAVIVDLPYGRAAELEADQHGLFYMASAGYDPREAVAFWTRMAAAGESSGSDFLSAFLSTHPSDEQRIEQIEQLLPAAIGVYESSLLDRGLAAP